MYHAELLWEQETKTTSVDRIQSRPTPEGRKYLSQEKKKPPPFSTPATEVSIANLSFLVNDRSLGPTFLSKSSTPIGTPTNSPHQAPIQTITPESSCRRESACARQQHSLPAARSPSLPPPIEINQITPRAMAHPAMTPRCTKSPDKTASAKTSLRSSCGSTSTAPACRNRRALLDFCIPSAKSDGGVSFACGFSRRLAPAATPAVCLLSAAWLA
jgi:hypothetical protein